jgi:hypothetical protein
MTQVKGTRGQIWGTWEMWYANHLMNRHESFNGSARMSWTVIHMSDQLFRMWFPRSKTDFFVKWCQHMKSSRMTQVISGQTLKSCSMSLFLVTSVRIGNGREKRPHHDGPFQAFKAK